MCSESDLEPHNFQGSTVRRLAQAQLLYGSTVSVKTVLARADTCTRFQDLDRLEIRS
jgi:hypothetical protein